MKKRVFLSLMLWALILVQGALLPAGSVLADGAIPNLRDTPAPSAGIFSFRGGVHWNMSREQVRALEPIELTERNQDGWSVLLPLSPVEVSLYRADLVYMFYNDRLKMITYDFGAGKSEAEYQYLTGALDTVYGSHTEPSAADIVGVMDQIYPGYYIAGRLLNRRGWKAGDDTLIYQYYYAENAFAILYVCAGDAPAAYVTTGL